MMFLILVAPLMALADPFPKALAGRWHLKGYECKTGPLSDFGKLQSQQIPEKILQISSDGQVDSHLIDYGTPKDLKKPCDTLYRGKWNLRDGKILKSSMKLVPRNSVGDFSCVKTVLPETSSTYGDWPYALSNNQLKITHQDLSLKVQNGKKEFRLCNTPGPFVEIYER